MTAFGALEDSGPDGRNVQALSATNQFQLADLPSASPDGKLVVFSDGQILGLVGGRPKWRTALALPPNELVPDGVAFSAGDQDVVVLTEGPYFDESTVFGVAVVNAQSRVATALGTGSDAAGDPKAPGAIVAVASPPQAIVNVKNPATPDDELDLRDAGQPVENLGSAASLASDVGLDRSTPVALYPVPNPSGALVAVEVVDLLEPRGSNAGLVVLDRKGAAVAIETPGLGPAGGPLPAWSPDGTTLAYPSEGPGGPVIEVWAVGGTLASRPISAAADGECLWSPSGQAILCDSAQTVAGQVQQNWNLADAGSEASADVLGPGFPIAWFRG